MRSGRRSFFLALVFAALFAGQASAQNIILNDEGTTDEAKNVTLSADTGGGKLLNGLSPWLLELTIGSTKIDVSKCALLVTNNTRGHIIAPMNLKAGKYKVKIKVQFADGSTGVDERDVTFDKTQVECLSPRPRPVECLQLTAFLRSYKLSIEPTLSG